MATVKQYWWFLLLKGLLMLAIGFYMVLSPEGAIQGIAFYIGLILVTAGIISAWNTLRMNRESPAGPIHYFGPLMALVAGFILLFFSEYALAVFAISIGIWILMDGILHIGISSEISKPSKTLGTWLLFMGIFSLIVGVIIIMNPIEFIKLMSVLFGLILILSGGFLTVLSFSLKR